MAVSGGEYDSHVWPFRLDLASKIDTVQFGHDDVGDDQVERAAMLVQDFQRLAAMMCNRHFLAQVLQQVGHEFTDLGVVFHQQNFVFRAYRHVDSVSLRRQERSEERRVGKEWFITCRSRWSP